MRGIPVRPIHRKISQEGHLPYVQFKVGHRTRREGVTLLPSLSAPVLPTECRRSLNRERDPGSGCLEISLDDQLLVQCTFPSEDSCRGYDDHAIRRTVNRRGDSISFGCRASRDCCRPVEHMGELGLGVALSSTDTTKSESQTEDDHYALSRSANPPGLFIPSYRIMSVIIPMLFLVTSLLHHASFNLCWPDCKPGRSGDLFPGGCQSFHARNVYI